MAKTDTRHGRDNSLLPDEPPSPRLHLTNDYTHMNSYYAITSGPLHQTIKDFITKHESAQETIREWAQKYPEIAGVSGERVQFIKGHQPAYIWKKHKKGGYTPNKATKIGKAIAAEMAKLPSPGGSMSLLMSLMKVSVCKDIMKVNQTGLPGLKSRGDTYYLDADECWLPADRTGIEEIKASEYAAI